MSNEAIAELITRRRRQILAHSFIYYRMNDSIIPDHVFDAWSLEIVKLQSEYPDNAEKCEWHEEFIEFDGSTGAFLPLHEPKVMTIGFRALNAFKFVNKRK